MLCYRPMLSYYLHSSNGKSNDELMLYPLFPIRRICKRLLEL